MDYSNFLQAPSCSDLFNVKSMEAKDADMEKINHVSAQSVVANKNDPWEPLEAKSLTIPKILPAPTDPLRNMISSESYVKSLEKRLDKIKGKSEVVKPRDMIHSLHEARDLNISQYMSDSTTDTYSESFTFDTNDSVISSVQRRLNPEKQALNPQELVPLVQEDILAKSLAQDDSTQNAEITCSLEKT